MAKTNEGDFSMKPRVCILQSDGTNCDIELHYAFQKFGGNPQYVHVNELRSKDKRKSDEEFLEEIRRWEKINS